MKWGLVGFREALGVCLLRRKQGGLSTCCRPGILGMDAQMPLTFSTVKAVLFLLAPKSSYLFFCEPRASCFLFLSFEGKGRAK